MSTPTALVPIDPLQLARSTILAPSGMDDGHLGRALDLILGNAVDSADLYFQVSQEESWALEDGIVKEGSASIEQGVGVRALAGECAGFTYQEEITPPALEEPARAARAISSGPPRGGGQAWNGASGPQLYP